MATVLLVDDDSAILVLLSELLEDEGYRVVTACDGQEALACVAAEQPDLILSDVMMPVLDGGSMCRALRADLRWHTLPVVLMSAAALPAEYADAGHTAFLGKPIDLDLLVATLARCLALRRGVRQASTPHPAVTSLRAA